MSQTKRRPWVVFALMFLPGAIVTWGAHEYAHWQTGEALGYDMWISFNQVGLAGDQSFATVTDRILVDAAGPVVTCAQAILALVLIYWSGSLLLYPFLFLAFWTRALALGISLISLPNDEARISLALGLPLWTLPVAVSGFLLVLAALGSRFLKVGWTGNAIAYVIASLVTTAVVFGDPGPLF